MSDKKKPGKSVVLNKGNRITAVTNRGNKRLAVKIEGDPNGKKNS